MDDPPETPTTCSVDGCERRHIAHGLCDTHYRRWKKHGNALIVKRPRILYGPEHPQWRGNNVDYVTLHDRLRRRWRPGPCAICGAEATEWAYDHADPDERHSTNSGGYIVAYSFDINHYFPACMSCHRRLDRRLSHLRRKRSPQQVSIGVK